MNENIQVIGLEDFDSEEKRKIIDYAENYAEKIFRDIKGHNMMIHAKKHNKDGKRAKYSFNVKIQTPENLINVKDSDWVLATALHKSFEKVKNNVQHKFKTKGNRYVK